MALIGKKNQKITGELEVEIEELRRKNQELEQLLTINNEALVNKISSLVSAGYIVWNIPQQKLLYNETLESLFENCLPSFPFSVDELINNSNAEDQEFLKEVFSEPKGQKKKITGQFRLTYRSKDFREIKYFQLSGLYEKSGKDETVLTLVVRDITKENKQIRELQRNLDRAEESDRIKTLFLLNISHNIRTPMNSIMGFAELLNLTDPGPERRSDYIQTIKRQSKNLLQLIDDVSEVAKYESGIMTITKAPVNLNFLLKETIRDAENIRTSVRKENVKIFLSVPAGEGLEIFADAGRLHQIFVNLINHSLKYTNEGSIELGYTLPVESRINFFVKDTSQGINKDEMKSLLEMFTQISKGEISRYDDETRLSLTIARSIIKLLGGKLNFDTESGTGNIFNFSMPYEAPPSGKQEISEEELAFQQQYKWNDKVILLVEDEEVNGLFLEAVFHETGAQTLYAKNGKQAVELCKSINKIDLILMDIRMPVMNGLKATQEIRKFNRYIPIIAQTALSLEEDRQQCLLAGCNDTVTKPIEIEELLRLVNKYFSH
jgi:signal transduction histidine kinase/CheY-like chemotaxis protein